MAEQSPPLIRPALSESGLGSSLGSRTPRGRSSVYRALTTLDSAFFGNDSPFLTPGRSAWPIGGPPWPSRLAGPFPSCRSTLRPMVYAVSVMNSTPASAKLAAAQCHDLVTAAPLLAGQNGRAVTPPGSLPPFHSRASRLSSSKDARVRGAGWSPSGVLALCQVRLRAVRSTTKALRPK